MTRKILDAIDNRQDVFQLAHHAQTTLIRNLHGELIAKIAGEHGTTRTEIIREIEVRLSFQLI
jgi:hypothetical protein